jgi:hypothetical protein
MKTNKHYRHIILILIWLVLISKSLLAQLKVENYKSFDNFSHPVFLPIHLCLGGNPFFKIHNTSITKNDDNFQNLQDTSINGNQADIFGGIGFYPFEISLGGGYYIQNNLEIIVQYSSMFLPLSLNDDVFLIGTRFRKNRSQTLYSVSFGIPFQREKYFSDGYCIEGSVGSLMQTGVGFYFLPSLKIGSLIRNKENSIWIIGFDLKVGWLIK